MTLADGTPVPKPLKRIVHRHSFDGARDSGRGDLTVTEIVYPGMAVLSGTSNDPKWLNWVADYIAGIVAVRVAAGATLLNITGTSALLIPVEEDGIFWKPRGIGSDYNLIDLASGDTHELVSNISGFVRSQEDGERLVSEVFEGRARLDFRKSEPGWIQVKVGCTDEAVLSRLRALVSGNGDIITKDIVKRAVAGA